MSSLNKFRILENKRGSGLNGQNTRPNDSRVRPKECRGFSKVPDSNGAHIQRLGCPQYKNNPSIHRQCAKRSFTTLKALKSHIYACHIQPEYCTHCGATFKDRQSRDNHIAVTHPGQYSDRPHDEPDGVNIERERELRGLRLSPRLTVAEKWYAIFDIACPGHPRPSSPYHESEACPCCAKLADLRGFAIGDSDTETFSNSLRQSSDWRPESEAPLREGLNHWLGNSFDQCANFQNDVPEDVVGEDALEAPSDSISTCLNSSEPLSSEYTNDRHIPGSASSIAPAQPTSEARDDASYALGVPQISTFLQAGVTSDIPTDDNSPNLDYNAGHTTPNLDTVMDFEFPFHDFPGLALPEDLVVDGGDDSNTHSYGR